MSTTLAIRTAVPNTAGVPGSAGALSQISGRGSADDAIREVLLTQWRGVPAVRVDSPPGAGKTGVVERLAVQGMVLLHERCMVVTQTNEQAFDIGRRFARGYPDLPFVLFLKQGLAVPDDLPRLTNLHLAYASRELPAGPCIAIANAARWSWHDEAFVVPFDCQIVDEAFQLPDYRFQQIAGLARRVVLVGDPGQIDPVVTCAIERWRCDRAGPHVSSPQALLARHPDVLCLALPVTRRLVPDTVRFVQPAFYPALPFTALSPSAARALHATREATREARQDDGLDEVIDLAAGGASIVQLDLPTRITGEVDETLAETVVTLIQRLGTRGARVLDDHVPDDGDGVPHEQPLTPDMIGVVCAHVAQVNAVRERLPVALAGVFVETADRFQGLERPVTIVHHPLSGRADASAFHLDAGRLCVMLSRHRVACFVFARAGIEDMLLRHAPSGDRVLGLDADPEFEGWRAHLAVLARLRCEGRIVSTG